MNTRKSPRRLSRMAGLFLCVYEASTASSLQLVANNTVSCNSIWHNSIVRYFYVCNTTKHNSVAQKEPCHPPGPGSLSSAILREASLQFLAPHCHATRLVAVPCFCHAQDIAQTKGPESHSSALPVCPVCLYGQVGMLRKVFHLFVKMRK